MSAPQRAILVRYGRFLAGVAATTLGLAALGWFPTKRLGGEGALEAMGAGLAAVALASVVGALPYLFTGPRPEPHTTAGAAIASIVLRLLVALGLAAAAWLSGRFVAMPLAAWLGIGYMALLFVDTRFALAAFSASRAGKS